MKHDKKLLTLIALITFSFSNAHTISIVGMGVNGWPPTNGPEITLASTDNIVYSISNLAVTTGFVKFRQNFDWAVNWGGTSFPSGTGSQGGLDINIPTASTYYVTFEPLTGNYTFTDLLSNTNFEKTNFSAFPNPSGTFWILEGNAIMEKIELSELSGKIILTVVPTNTSYA